MAEIQYILAAAIQIMSDFELFACGVAFERFRRLEMTAALVVSVGKAGFGAREAWFSLFFGDLLPGDLEGDVEERI